MVVRIRLARWGASKNPFYGVVIANNRAARDGRHIERVGTYNPVPDTQGVKRIELNVERIKYWLGVGAQPSDRVAWLLAKLSMMPLKPEQRQNQGLVSLNDRKTWDVEVRNAEGKPIALLSPQEARTLLAGSSLVERLPSDLHESNRRTAPEKSRLVRNNIKLDGTPPAAPLTEQEKLLVLKEVAGIS
ncbi:hypothetical protein HKX48_006000 [Thoreauomyces humboldtii]|nr:hypothetical protein HKX48_006000 [Thoreauomyces humboldtii]